MWGDMSLWNVQGPLLHSGDHIVPRILTVDYTFNDQRSSCNVTADLICPSSPYKPVISTEHNSQPSYSDGEAAQL